MSIAMLSPGEYDLGMLTIFRVYVHAHEDSHEEAKSRKSSTACLLAQAGPALLAVPSIVLRDYMLAQADATPRNPLG
jgi:hypothetical protein